MPTTRGNARRDARDDTDGAGEDDKSAPAAAAGADTQEKKRYLRLSRRQPVNCALGTGPDGCVLVFDRNTPPKVLLAKLRKAQPGLRTPLYGTVAVDAGSDPKLATFQLNKAPPGLRKQIKVTLKGTGFTKVAVERTSAQPAGADDGA